MRIKCPLTFRINSMNHPEWAPCMKKNCGFWICKTPVKDLHDEKKWKGECGILTIAKSLKEKE